MSGIAITFPTSPSEGQNYLAQNGFTYIYDSSKNRWKRGGEFVRSPKVLSFAGESSDQNYEINSAFPGGEVGVDSFKAYRDPSSYPDHTEIQVSTSSNFGSVAYAATFSGLTHTIPYGVLEGDTTYYLRARQFVGDDASSASVGAISGYSQNPIRFITTSITIDTPTIVSIVGTTNFPVYKVGFGITSLSASETYTGSGVENLDKIEYEIVGPRIPSSTGDTALAEVGVGTLTSSELASALVFAMPLSGAVGAGLTDEVHSQIRSASGVGGGTTRTITNTGVTLSNSDTDLKNSSFYYSKYAYFRSLVNNKLTVPNSSDFQFGTGDFTIECYVYTFSVGNPDAIIKCADNDSYSNGWSVGVQAATLTDEKIIFTSNGSVYSSSKKLRRSKWIHLAWVRKSGLVTLYVDGTIDASFSITDNYTPTGDLVIGSRGTTDYFNGYIRDIRIYKGVAKYVEEFTPPAPLYGTITYTEGGVKDIGVSTTTYYKSTGVGATADVSSTAANALVLAMPMNNTFGFADINNAVRTATPGASSGTTLTTTPSATLKIRTTNEGNYYDSVGYFNGTSDYVTINGSSQTALGSGDFTIEGWVYSYESADGGSRVVLDKDIGGSVYSNFKIYQSGSSLYFSSANNDTAWNVNELSIGALKLKTWNHFRIRYARSINLLSTYLNGIRSNLLQPAALLNLSSTANLYVGCSNSIDAYWHGLIQDIKIYKGYFESGVSSFSPPPPICGDITDISTQTGFTTTTDTGELLSSVVGLGSTASFVVNDISIVPGSEYSLKVKNTSGLTTSSYSTISLWGTKSTGGIYDPYADNLVVAIPGGAQGGITTAFDVTGQIKLETPTSTYSSGQTVTSSIGDTYTNKTITLFGNVTDSATQSKYYGRSLYFDGASDYIEIGGSSDTAFGTGDFTIEGWFYTTTVAGAAGAITNYYNSIYYGNFLFYRNGGTMLFYSSNDGVNWNVVNAMSMGSILANTWTHLTIVRKNGVVSSFNNGNYVTSVSTSANLNSTEKTRIGDIASSWWNGYMQDIRIYKGVAKYEQNKNFIVPDQIYV